MTQFTFGAEDIQLPKGAFAKTARRWLAHDGKRIFALTNGPFRPYLFPLFSPAGYLLSSESPADHPHHNSLWLGADHVHLMMPTSTGHHEEYTYNFYVNETFQGRAPGRQVEVACVGERISDACFRLCQQIEWRGPPEWAAPAGRLILLESRVTEVTPGNDLHRISITSSLSAAGPAVQLGPTRHALFNARVAETMVLGAGGKLYGPRGVVMPDAITPGTAWVDFTGPVGGGARAGITMLPHPVRDQEHTWFVSDWGVMTTGAFRAVGVRLSPGQKLDTGCTYLLHDGDIPLRAVEAVAASLPIGTFPDNKDHTP